VDTYTFLAVVNFTINDFTNYEDDDQLNVPTLLHYLKASHAYYLDFQNRRPDHLAALWQIIDWNTIEKRYQQTT
jgi:superoxide dismutase